MVRVSTGRNLERTGAATIPGESHLRPVKFLSLNSFERISNDVGVPAADLNSAVNLAKCS
jgi:hypothetical protein